MQLQLFLWIKAIPNNVCMQQALAHVHAHVHALHKACRVQYTYNTMSQSLTLLNKTHIHVYSQGADPGFRKGGSKNHIQNGGGYGILLFHIVTCTIKMNVLLTVILFENDLILTASCITFGHAILKKG